MKNKKARINPKNNDGKSFQYATVIALNFETIKERPTKSFKIVGHL